MSQLNKMHVSYYTCIDQKIDCRRCATPRRAGPDHGRGRRRDVGQKYPGESLVYYSGLQVATARYFYGSILLRALKPKIIVLLTYSMYIRNNVHLINMENFYFEDVQFYQS